MTEKDLPKELLMAPALREASAALNEAKPETLILAARERETILMALAKSNGNKKKAAQLLGIHRPTLYSKMKRYRIDL